MTQENRRPVLQEQGFERLAVTGTIPPGLRGTLFRNGPNPRHPAPDQHWFGGDGMVHAFTLSEHGVAYRNRWVRTAHWHREDRAGRSLFRGLGQPRDGGGPVPAAPHGAPEGVANTSILHHAGRLAALEEGHAPAGLDPATLDTVPGPVWPVGGQPFTAHPKRDPDTGALWFFGAASDGPFSPGIRIGALGPDGRMQLEARIEAPYCALVHDFAVTERHVVLPLFPLVRDREQAVADGPGLTWEPGRGCFLGVMRRDDPEQSLRWLPVESCYAFHVLNAWEEADSLMIDLMQSDGPAPFTEPSGRAPVSRTSLWRWQVDLSRPGTPVRRTRLSALAGEFPQLDARIAGSRHRHGFFAADTRGAGRDAVCHRDEATGSETLFRGEPGDGLSEPVFVPRHASAAEGEGWLLAVQYRAADAHSALLVLDAAHVADGPVATVPLPCRVPDGFHGVFVGAGA